MNTIFAAENLKKSSSFAVKGKQVWCSSMVQSKDGKCHLYFSFWDETYGFEAWVTHSRIGYAVADSPEGEYRFISTILPAEGKGTAWDRDVAHNPTIQCFDSRYYLYYTGNFSDSGEWWDYRNHQRIGVAWSPAPEGPFICQEMPILEHPESVMTSNPSVCRMPSGRYIMVYKFVKGKNPGPFYGPVCHGVAFSDSPEGPFLPVDGAFFQVAGSDFPGEDPFVFCMGTRLYCLVKDNGTHYSEISKSLILFESDDGLRWKQNGVALTRHLRREDGQDEPFFRMERPQLTFCKDQTRLFCAVKPLADKDTSYSINFKIESDIFRKRGM